ncbi:MAG: MBL fold metallo-hydrolase [Eubacteriales bacterium]|nr:MBL fold metallo-hydrolase [Eubacteriales bacterium]
MSKIQVGVYTIGMVQTNFYYLHLEDSNEVVVFDPADNGDLLYEKLTAQGLQVRAIFLTHAHFDHILGANELRELAKAPLYAYEEEQVLCEDADNNCSRECGKPYTVVPDRYLKDAEAITAAGITVHVIATPGHTVGSCCYYIEHTDGEEIQHILMSGDTLFEESIGRTDLPTGSTSALIRSIRDRLFELPDDTTVCPGHGGFTTIGHEKKYNAFV